jgi:DNA polymerase III epsilon subunit-like protein
MIKYVIIDVEATGSNYGTDLIFEIAAIFIQDNAIIDEFHSYVKIPYDRIRLAQQQICHIVNINMKAILEAPSYYTVISQLMSKIQKENIGEIKMVAHNVMYDYNIIYNNSKHHACEYASIFVDYFSNYKLDTINLAKKIFKDAPRFALSHLSHYIAKKEDNVYLTSLLKQRKLHTAIIDTRILAELFLIMYKKNPLLCL